MTPKVFSVEMDRSVDECMVLMSENRIRHLPVIDGTRVIGMLSIGDILKTILNEKQLLIEQLENYISGTG
jgi:signal-transduction protein with cAMP-binding, CBS, and nucleotidyltransferase domain